MRIISGTFKGRRIATPKNLNARPTTDFAKEGLFNLLDNRFDYTDTNILELFAGSGNIGLEFVSRGVRHVTALEWDARNLAFLKKVCGELHISNYQPLRADVFEFVKTSSGPYDLVFADPPYANPRLAEIPDLVFGSNLVAPKGWLILEHGRANNFAEHPNFVEERHYGNVHFSFFQPK